MSGKDLQPSSELSIIPWWPSFSCLPPPLPNAWYEERTNLPPFLPTLLCEEFLWTCVTIKSECKLKVAQYSLAATQNCGFTVILTSSSSLAKKSHLFIISRKKSELSLPVELSSCHSIVPLATWSRLSAFLLVSLADVHAVLLPCLTTMRTIWSTWTQAWWFPIAFSTFIDFLPQLLM